MDFCKSLLCSIGLALALALSGCAHKLTRGDTQKGEASYYANSYQGHRTANGERFNMNDMTAAHRTLPMNSMVRVTSLSNGRSVVVRINDRGPYSGRRIIDLSYAAAKELNLIQTGVDQVEIQVLSVP